MTRTCFFFFRNGLKDSSSRWTTSLASSDLKAEENRFPVLQTFLLPCLALTLLCRWMVWLGIYFLFLSSIYMDTQDHTTYHVWIHLLLPTSYARGQKKNHLVWAGIEPRSFCLTSDHSNHQTMVPRAKHCRLKKFWRRGKKCKRKKCCRCWLCGHRYGSRYQGRDKCQAFFQGLLKAQK